MPKGPRLSVLVTGRNTLPFLKECLDSVLEQTFRDFECLICDDGSDDGSAENIHGWIAKYGDSRFHLYANTERHYAPSTTKHLIDRSHGEICAWIGGDDKLSGPHSLARIIRAWNSDPEVDATYGSFLTIPKMAAWPLRLHPRGYPWWEGWSFSHILTFRRSLALASFQEEWNTPAYRDSFGEVYRTAGDVAIYYGVMFRARAVAFIPDVIYLYRRHPGNDDLTNRQAQLTVEQRICEYWTGRVLTHV